LNAIAAILNFTAVILNLTAVILNLTAVISNECERSKDPSLLRAVGMTKMVVATSPQAIKKAASFEAAFSILVADRTGLEPATSGVTGRHSNQLNYRSA
jgi:hypothetical protein